MSDELNALLCDYDNKPDRAIAARAAEILAEPYTDRENLAIRIARLETAREIAAQPGELPLQGDIRAQAHAWIGVTELLNELSPGWQERSGLGKDIALDAIRDLATAASSPPHVADALDGERFEVVLESTEGENVVFISDNDLLKICESEDEVRNIRVFKKKTLYRYHPLTYSHVGTPANGEGVES